MIVRMRMLWRKFTLSLHECLRWAVVRCGVGAEVQAAAAGVLPAAGS